MGKARDPSERWSLTPAPSRVASALTSCAIERSRGKGVGLELSPAGLESSAPRHAWRAAVAEAPRSTWRRRRSAEDTVGRYHLRTALAFVDLVAWPAGSWVLNPARYCDGVTPTALLKAR